MDQTTITALNRAGFNTDDALKRFLDNDRLFLLCLNKLLHTPIYSNLKEAINNKDCQGAFDAAHNLKSVCGNLSHKSLYQLFAIQTECFREGDFEQGVVLMSRIEPVFDTTLDALSAIISSNPQSPH